MGNEATIIPIASGKGGVGKTLLTANIGVALAQLGHSTVVVDLDLGGANLHAALGIPNDFPGIGDALKLNRGQLSDLLVPTPITNLKFLPGDGRIPFMANITHHQKMRLILQLRSLPARYVLLDIGAGSAFNVLDFFGVAAKGILVTVPELPALMNMMTFLKNFIFRCIEQALRQNYDLANFLYEQYNRASDVEPVTVRSLQEQIRTISPDAQQKILKICGHYQPRIILNMGLHPNELESLSQISRNVEEILSLQIEYFGFVFQDTQVRKAMKQRSILLSSHPQSIASESIHRIADRITRLWDQEITNSAELLINNTKQAYQRFVGHE